MAVPETDGTHRRVRINYAIRAGAFGYCFLVLGVHGWQLGFGAAFWICLALQFLVYPHLAYLRARHARDSKRAEEINVYLDAGLLGAWIAFLQFPTWLAYAALFSTTLNAMVLSGVRGALRSVGGFAAGAALAIAFTGLRYSPETSDAVTLLSFAGSLAYSCAVGYVAYTQKRRLAGARDALRSSEERYKLIADNAGDLIAMVDQDGRWLYASPSYRHVLDAADLAPGSDAFARVHPDDAEHARTAVLRTSVTGNPRDIALRLVDRDGRTRQYKTRVQALDARRLLLVSQDVTDLRESEERLLLAANAFDGMSEAMVITAADGSIVTVNRAFCELTGYARDDVFGQSEKTIRNALQPPDFYDEIYATVLREGYWSGTTWARRRDGSLYRERRSLRALRDANGAVTHYIMVFSDVDAKRPGIDITNPNLRG
jgi:PAS domain S-box-containing protein